MGSSSSNSYCQIPRLLDYGFHKRLTVRSVKLFADGALGSWGAALIAPYTDKPDTRGLLRIPPETLRRLVEQSYENGLQVVRILAIFRSGDQRVA
jgi:predicted amidohydrolase YtcJ